MWSTLVQNTVPNLEIIYHMVTKTNKQTTTFLIFNTKLLLKNP